MKIIDYKDANNIYVKFEDKYGAIVKCAYREFVNGKVKNPYYPEVYGHGMIGQKYETSINGLQIKESITWRSMLSRVFSKTVKERQPTYNATKCCEDWLLYENFYEWLHEQENFIQWKNGNGWALDKDIISKGNTIYSPDMCCLVPQSINSLFNTHKKTRGSLPIGITFDRDTNKYKAYCNNPLLNNQKVGLGYFENIDDAFYTYKKYKENTIQRIANIEFQKGNITKKCYDSMMKYIVEITD